MNRMTPKSLMADSLVMLLVGTVAAARHAPSPPTQSSSVVNDQGSAVEDKDQDQAPKKPTPSRKDSSMHASTSTFFFATAVPPAEYEAAVADVERRALAGQLTLAQAKREIFELRDRFAPQPSAHAQRAAPGRS